MNNCTRTYNNRQSDDGHRNEALIQLPKVELTRTISTQLFIVTWFSLILEVKGIL